MDLSHNGLTSLPESLGQLTQLQKLYLTNNQLTALPEWLGVLTRLQALNLSSNQLTALPESLGQLTQLRTLHLSINQLKSLPESLGQLTQLQTLNLFNNRLTSLPESLVQLAQVQTLDLSYNGLTSLPESLGQLTQLQTLNLSSNCLVSLPESLGQLTQLQTLNLSNNRLTVLPESLGQLTQLQTLAFMDNELTALPKSLGQLTQLQSLHLSGNRLTALPKSLGQLTQLQSLDLMGYQLAVLPEWLSHLTRMQTLNLSTNRLEMLPEWLGQLTRLQMLDLHTNHLTTLPESLGRLTQLETLYLHGNQLKALPESLGQLTKLLGLDLTGNRLTALPESLGQLTQLRTLDLMDNPLNPELEVASREGIDAVKRYLQSQAAASVELNEAKLIVIGEGEVGKSCLLGALRGDDWIEDRDTTHGIEIKPVTVTEPKNGREITLNGWDFGGQRVYRPTHQLFFSAPAVYLVVWKPREGSQAGAVKEWIKLVKHREPDAKILVVATHGGPKARQPDIDRQEIWDLFGRETVVDFFHVDSRPPSTNKKTGKQEGKCAGIKGLSDAIADVAAKLPEMGRKVPRSWQEARAALKQLEGPYLPLRKILEICATHKMDQKTARLFVTISHRLGHLIHYQHDPALRDIVILKPDWLATAISFVLDDSQTRDNQGLVSLARLGQLWNDPERAEAVRYELELHPIFLRLMERYDLSYHVPDPRGPDPMNATSLIAQLVPDIRPQERLEQEWTATPSVGDTQQVQICQIVDLRGNSATAEGLLYQLIVRLHKYSLGRLVYARSIHWQRGLMLEDFIGSRALMEHLGNDIRITVRAPYPERFLSALTYEVQYLVESFWPGLRCLVMVPCLNPHQCSGLFEVSKLMENMKRGRPEQPCPLCNEWQNIEHLLHNAPAARANPLEELVLTSLVEVHDELRSIGEQLRAGHGEVVRGIGELKTSQKELLGRVEAAYTHLIRMLLDEAKDGPRLFSFHPVDPGFFDRPKWISHKFRVTLWCEHSRQPLPALNGKDDKRGVYELTLPRDWLVKAAPFLKILTSTLSLVLPVAASATKLLMDAADYKEIEKQLDLGQKSLDSVLKGGEKAGAWLGKSDAPKLEHGEAIRADGSALRQLHAWLKEKDPSFGGLIRVQNKRQEFLWVHPQFEAEY
jgi:Leucine-rich repeat (LRR) protein